MRAILAGCGRGFGHLAAATAAVASLALFSSAALACQGSSNARHAGDKARSGSGGSIAHVAKDRHSQPSHEQFSPTSDVQLRWKVYTGSSTPR